MENPRVRNNMINVGIPAEGKYARARAYLYAKMERQILWLDVAPELRAALEETLTGALFIF